MQTEQTAAERAAFEAWFENVHLEYAPSVPEHAWGAWQARAALATKPAGAGGAVGLTKYDPNIRWANTTMALTYMMWDYSLTVEVSMGGNCKGFDVMDTAIETHAEQLFKEQGEHPVLMLTRPGQSGSPEDDTLECTPDDEDTERWLSRMCVGIRIVGHEESKS